MIILGIILIVVGYIVPISIVATIGWILLVIGLILLILGWAHGPVYGRKHYF